MYSPGLRKLFTDSIDDEEIIAVGYPRIAKTRTKMTDFVDKRFEFYTIRLHQEIIAPK